MPDSQPNQISGTARRSGRRTAWSFRPRSARRWSHATSIGTSPVYVSRLDYHTSGSTISDARSYHFSWNDACPPHVVQAIARHSDVKITLKVYAL
jgi:hypothetical protein